MFYFPFSFYCKRDDVNVIWAYVRFYENVFKDSFESEIYESIGLARKSFLLCKDTM